jgi:heterotetrameric sarcosine oxidase delta subunit
MLLIVCPHCGPRNDSEFTYQGEPRVRPTPDTSPAVWRRYLYEETNAAGWATEQWFHAMGCRRFLHIERHTVTNEIRAVRDLADG